MSGDIAPEWFTDIVKTTCKRFGFAFKFTPSLTSAKPIF